MIPTISIIIPVYNVEKYLRECLNSVVAQTFTDWECILVDDGSKDSSPAICDEYAQRDPRFTVIHKENGGPSKARNAGLDIARGEWISFIDADDWVDDGYFDSLLNAKCKADLIVFGMTIHRQNGNSSTLRMLSKYYTDSKEVLDAIYNLKNTSIGYDFFGMPWNKFYRNDIIRANKVTFPEDISFFEDQVFVLRYMQKIQNLLVSNESPYNYRIVDSGLTRGIKRSATEYAKISEYYIQEIEFLKDTPAGWTFQKDIVSFYTHAISVARFGESIRYTKVLSNYAKKLPKQQRMSLGKRVRLLCTLGQIPLIGLPVMTVLRSFIVR
jgi:glycosyltransferase involved in cell wall biosynthesis